MPRPTLVVVLGAGASLRAGVPSTAQLTDALDAVIPGKTSLGWVWPLNEEPPTDQTLSDAFAIRLRISARQHFQNPNFAQGYQFENLLGVVEELEDYAWRQTFVSRVATLGSENAVLDDTLMLGETRSRFAQAIHRQVGEAVSRPEVREHPAARQARRLLRRLASHFRLVVVDLNYDDIADDALVAWSDGFTQRLADALAFDPEQWFRDVADDERHLLVHLHGSVRFGQRPPGAQRVNTPEEPAKYPSYDIAKDHTSNGSSHKMADGRSYSAPYVISGISKASKLVYNLRPYGNYLSALSQIVPACDALLSIGYGCGDPHVNALLDEFIAQRPKAPVAVVTHRSGADAGENQLPTEGYLARLGRPQWRLIENFAHAGAAGKATSWAAGRLRLFPHGFPLSQRGLDAAVSHLRQVL